MDSARYDIGRRSPQETRIGGGGRDERMVLARSCLTKAARFQDALDNVASSIYESLPHPQTRRQLGPRTHCPPRHRTPLLSQASRVQDAFGWRGEQHPPGPTAPAHTPPARTMPSTCTLRRGGGVGMRCPPRHACRHAERRRGLASRSAPLADASLGSRPLSVTFLGSPSAARRAAAAAAGGEPRRSESAKECDISVSAGGAGWSKAWCGGGVT